MGLRGRESTAKEAVCDLRAASLDVLVCSTRRTTITRCATRERSLPARRLAFPLAAVVLLAAVVTERASAAEFYDGKTIRLIIGNNTSGGYAVFGRLFAQYLGRHIPGDPKIAVQYI